MWTNNCKICFLYVLKYAVHVADTCR